MHKINKILLVLSFFLIVAIAIILSNTYIQGKNRMLFNKFYLDIKIMNNIRSSIIKYRKDIGTYPNDLEELINYNHNFYNMPLNPWGNKYIYKNYNVDFEIISLGKDNSEGGSFYNSDIKFTKDKFIIGNID